MKQRMFQQNSRLSINISSKTMAKQGGGDGKKNACLSALRYNMRKRYYCEVQKFRILHKATGLIFLIVKCTSTEANTISIKYSECELLLYL
jgi:hypothetical protein